MTFTVIIPTYRRPKELERCLEALRKQVRPADEILAVARGTDEETKAFLEKIKSDFLNLRIVTVTTPGQVNALNAGLSVASGDIIAFIDDDALPYPDWLKLIEQHFQGDSKVGGVGGRDKVFIEGKEVICSMSKVGIISWYGRIIGSHHLGAGNPREVDHLKGSNMSFRKEAIKGFRFDTNLRGKGAQYRNDLAMCLVIKQKGWKLIYDPQILIDHYYATRFDEDQRGKFDAVAVEELAHNEMLVILNYMCGWQKFSCILYSLLVSSIATPGIFNFIRMLLKGQKDARPRLKAGMKGRFNGLKTFMNQSTIRKPKTENRKPKRIAFLISHPIQYMSPFFCELAKVKRVELTVLYCSEEGIKSMADKGFGKNIKWDVPLLEGYNYKFLKNYSPFPTIFKPPFGLMNFRIINEILKGKYDAVIIHGWHYLTYWLTFLICLLTGKPFFIRSESPLNQEVHKPKWKIFIKKIFLAFLFKKAKGLFAIGRQNKGFYIFYGAKEEKIFLTPYAVDNKRFIRSCEKLIAKKNELKKGIGIPLDRIVMLFSAKLISKKRPMDLLKAYEALDSGNKALIFLGDGNLRESLEKYAAEKKLQNIYFAGFKNQTEIVKYYTLADIFVLTSGAGETWGLAVNEAMCFHLPIIVSGMAGCSKDLVKNGENGFVFKTGDVEELTACLNKVIKNSGLRKEMGEKSFDIVKRQDYKVGIKSIIAALERL